MKRIILIILSIIAVTQGRTQSFDSLIHQIIGNNPEYIAAEAVSDSELLQMRSENNLSDPEIGFQHMWAPSGVKNKWNASISQSFDWPGVYKVRNKAIQNATSAMEYLRQSRYIAKSLEIKLLFIDIINIRKNIELCDSSLSLFSNLLSHYTTGFKHGEFTRLDVNKIRVEQLALNRQRASLMAQLGILESTLTALNGGKECSEILSALSNYPTESLLSVAEYENIITIKDPQLHYQSLMVESQYYQTKATRMSRFPSFALGYAYANEEGHSFNGFTISVSIPIFSSRNKVKASVALQRAYTADLNGMKVNRITSMVADHAIASSLLRELTNYRTILDDTYLTILRKALDGGEMTLITYIQEVNFYRNAMADMLSVEYQYYQALARLNRYSSV